MHVYVYLMYVASGTCAVRCDVYVCVHGYRQEEGWKDGRMEGWKEGRKEGWKDERMK